MSVHFPDFEDDANGEAQGPMRMMQLLECARVMGAVNAFGMEGTVSDKAVRKALIATRQARECESRERVRNSAIEGLMKNPAPRSFGER